MNTQSFIIENLLPVAIGLMVLWVAYRLLFSNSNRFQFNRFYLLTAMLFSLALPLFGLLMGQSSPQMVAFKENLFNGTVLNEIIISYGDQPVNTLPEVVIMKPERIHLSLWLILGVVYLVGVAVTALLFLFKMGKLVAMIIRSPKRKMDGYTMVFTHKEHGPYSFFRFAFFPDEQVDPAIVRHELSHIAHHHSWDILLAELMKIFQWFNPFVYLYKRELQSLHEYIADDDVVADGADKRNYMMLILQQCTAVDFSDMSNNFSLILTKKRIKMITKHEKAKGFWWKLLATLPVLALLLIVNARASAQQMTKTDNTVRESNTPEITDIKFNVVDNDTIYDIVEVMPEYPGGMDMMMKYFSENIKYPEEAKEKGISGKVFISFVIEKDGSVTEVKVLRSIGGGCDEEALRVVKAMPKWKPGLVKGQPVRVHYNLPITFKLDGVKSNGLAGTTWEGTGKGTKDKVNYTMHMTMEIEGAIAGYFVMTLTSEKQGKTTVEFEDVGLPFTYTFDGKSMGSINPTNPDGSTMTDDAQPPYGFTLDEKGNMIVNFYDMKEDIGVEKIVFTKKQPAAPQRATGIGGKPDMKPDQDGIWSIAETMPEYPGGMEAMRAYMQENLTVPEKYKEMDAKAEYRVFVRFVVAEDGSVTNVELLKPEPSKQDLNDEAVRVVKAMPKWKPGTVDGKPVKVSYTLPVTYRLGK